MWGVDKVGKSCVITVREQWKGAEKYPGGCAMHRKPGITLNF